MSGDRFDGFALVDVERSACLCDVGLAGYVVAWCIAPDGQSAAWLVSDAELLNGENAQRGNPNQPHEQIGRLPSYWRARAARPPHRCGRPRADGRPCRQAVKIAGRPCVWHAERATAP